LLRNDPQGGAVAAMMPYLSKLSNMTRIEHNIIKMTLRDIYKGTPNRSILGHALRNVQESYIVTQTYTVV
jgi:hypothetical protein